MDVAERLFDEPGEAAAIRELDLDVRLILRQTGIAGHGHALADALDCWIVYRGVRVLVETGPPANESNGRTVVHGEFALEAARDVLLVAQVQDQWRHPQPDGG